MNSLRKILPIGLMVGFFGLGLMVFLESRPTVKNGRMYDFVKQYSPYTMEKRFGGITIIDSRDPKLKSKPSNTALFREFESLEREWGQKHLAIRGDSLIIIDTNASLSPLFAEDLEFLHSYYGVKR